MNREIKDNRSTTIKEGNNEKEKNGIKTRKIVAYIIIAILIFSFCLYENYHLVITEYSYQNSFIAKEFDGFRIVQISDLHNFRLGKNNSLLAEKISQLEPDIIVITGDIVDSDRSDIDATIEFTKKLCGICPVYFVTGNHESWLSADNYEKLKNGLITAGVKWLDNEYELISRNEAQIAIVGVDDKHLVDATLERIIPENVFNIVLAHEPQYLSGYAFAGADLVFTGHAHGGQFRIPFVGGVVAPNQGIFPKYTEGIHISGNTTMIISRGLGNSVIPVRIFNDPELVLVTINN